MPPNLILNLPSPPDLPSAFHYRSSPVGLASPPPSSHLIIRSHRSREPSRFPRLNNHNNRHHRSRSPSSFTHLNNNHQNRYRSRSTSPPPRMLHITGFMCQLGDLEYHEAATARGAQRNEAVYWFEEGYAGDESTWDVLREEAKKSEKKRRREGGKEKKGKKRQAGQMASHNEEERKDERKEREDKSDSAAGLIDDDTVIDTTEESSGPPMPRQTLQQEIE